MFVDTGMLRSGAGESRRGGTHAGDGADHLAATSPTAGMFGDFDGAEQFHQTVSAAHTGHANQLRAHQQTLEHVAHKASHAATAFTDMDGNNAAQVGAVGCSSTT